MKRCILIVLFLCSTLLGQATQISTWADLAGIADDLTGDYVLMANLDANSTGYSTYAGPTANSNTGWSPLGSSSTMFTGSFDGQGYSISDIVISRSAHDQGLFSYVGSTGVVENLSILNASIDSAGGARYNYGVFAGQMYGTARNVNVSGSISQVYATIGGFVGNDLNGTYENCHADVGITATGDVIGGFVGRLRGATVSGCSASGNVYSTYTANGIGGFAGRIYHTDSNSTISRCKATGNVSGTAYAGGFIGYHWFGSGSSSTIENCYATGSVTRVSGTATSSFGGFAGRNRTGTISNSYSTGSVHFTGDTDPNNKGFCGNNGGTISNSFWDTTTSGQATSSGGTGKTTAQMKTLATFTDAGWDMVAIGDYVDETWYLDAGNDYPRLGWEYEEPAEPPSTGGRSQVIIIAKAATPGMVPIGVILLLPVLFGRRREP